ncbi:GNAT family N-acetyltransferase [Croceicoccus sp. F390]|uniref:GNAT family N-acetyltransferase n=1 Tax=Croceicoccus esteveae TaxID=3075597 RepID=A0ABU2ZJT1_9SPHN|nr:GNAT family N-acetyltransferase [Croceicoccus sp. F390]MDT0575819.1 GNAT family N-acetyltransferase [Croceicoccus sp. F390]
MAGGTICRGAEVKRGLEPRTRQEGDSTAAPDCVLRAATVADTGRLAALGRDSFNAAFGHLYAANDLAVFLAQTYSHEVVSREINDPGIRFCLAMGGDDLLGFCKLKLNETYGHSAASSPLVLAQLYTAPQATRRGIGAQLMHWTIAKAQAHGRDAIQLTVWSGNDGAQRFYQRFGFRKIADVDFWVGNHRDDELLYELTLDTDLPVLTR